MLKSLILAAAFGSFVPGFVGAAHACGQVCGGCAACSAAGGEAGMAMSAAPAAPPATASRSNRSYRTYSYEPGSGDVRSFSPSRMRGGFNSGTRGAASKVQGRYGR